MAVTTCPREYERFLGSRRACLEEIQGRRFWSTVMKLDKGVEPGEAELPAKAAEAIRGLGNAEYVVVDSEGGVYTPYRPSRRGYIVVIPHLLETAPGPEKAVEAARRLYRYAQGIEDRLKEWWPVSKNMGGLLVYRKPDGSYIIAPGVIVRERSRGIWLGYRWCVANPVALHRYEVMDLEKYLPPHCGTEKPITRIEK